MLFTEVNRLVIYKEIERNNTIDGIRSLRTFFMKKDNNKIFESEGLQIGLSDIKPQRMQVAVTQRIEVGKHVNHTNTILGLALDYVNMTHSEVSILMQKEIQKSRKYLEGFKNQS